MNPVTEYQQRANTQRRDQLVVENLEFVRHVLGRLTNGLPNSVDTENLEAAGILGLVEAAQQFDANRGVPFKGFAYSRIRGAILDELRRNSPLPQQMMQNVTLVRKAMEQLPQPHSIEDLATETGLDLTTVNDCLAAMRLTRIQSWDETFGETTKRQDQLEDPGQRMDEAEKREILADCIEQLPRQERLAITLYYLEDLRLKEIGQVLGLSESRISRLVRTAEARLRSLVHAHLG